VLLAAGHTSPKTRRTKQQRKEHPPRARREHFGEMLQGDASPFDWLGTGEELSLHGYIDDGTGVVTGLYMEKNECLKFMHYFPFRSIIFYASFYVLLYRLYHGSLV
jgi:hypothetical protein